MPQLSRVAVILAGGSGERFWPLSTPDRPKQLLKLANPNQTLLEEAISRVEPLFSTEHIFVATGSRIGPEIVRSGFLDAAHVLIEPVAKNTLGALCWAVAELQARGYADDATMAVLTADNAIGDTDRFRATVQTAMELAERTGGLVTIGSQPSRAETGYGYIQRGSPVEGGFRVQRFAEKPNADVAQSYVDSGEYLWNSGMFFWKIGAFLSELRRHVPEAAAILDRIPREPEAFDELPSIAIDRALMERSENIYVVPSNFPWDDVGAWDSLERTNAVDSKGNVIVGNVAMLDSTGSIVFSDEIPVGVVGVKDLIVVATPNGVLVCHKSQAQHVREIAAQLKGNA